MPRADFTVGVPERVWIGRLSRRYPDVVFRILSAFPGQEAGYGLLEIAADDSMAILAEIREADSVSTAEVVQSSEGRIVVQFETTQLPLLVTIQEAQIPLEMPIEIQNGEVTLEITAPRDRLSAFEEQLTALDIPHRLDRVYRTVEAESPLTDAQRQIVVAALESGYYDTPRETTLTELAQSLDMAPSTVSETLHRAEETIIKSFAEKRLEEDIDGLDSG
ncbi:MAG: helix-turn-helix domain-containing protein [Halobacteriaceae archaeon]